MFERKTRAFIRVLLLTLSFGFITEYAMTSIAEARAGSRRSVGQRSSPAMQPRSPAPQQPMMQPGQMQNPGRGSFMKGLAGGLAGGLLGSMLFSSLGHASGFGGGGGGGIGFLDIILIAGIAYLAYRLWKSRRPNPVMASQAVTSAPMGSSYTESSYRQANANEPGYFAQASGAPSYALPVSRLEKEEAEDIFFRVQGAWTRRDMSLAHDYLDSDMSRILQADADELKRNRSINRLENISVRNVQIGESWNDGHRELVQVRFTASLLDYTVDEDSGAVKEGSQSEPIKFDEHWIFAKLPGQSRWKLAGIEQIFA